MNTEQVRAVFDAFAARDAVRLLELVHPEIEFHTVTGPLAERSEPYRGHAGLTDYLRDVALVWEELRPEAQELRDVGEDTVLVLGRVYAWGSGRVIDGPAGWVWRMRDGLAVYGRVYESRGEALAAVGLDEQGRGSSGP